MVPLHHSVPPPHAPTVHFLPLLFINIISYPNIKENNNHESSAFTIHEMKYFWFKVEMRNQLFLVMYVMVSVPSKKEILHYVKKKICTVHCEDSLLSFLTPFPCSITTGVHVLGEWKGEKVDSSLSKWWNINFNSRRDRKCKN